MSLAMGVVSLVGRNRKPGRRKPSGRLKATASDGIPGAVWRRIKDHGWRAGVHPDLATTIGHMSLAKIITDTEATAAIWVAEVYGAYERLSGMPRRASASPAYERGWIRGTGGDGDAVSVVEHRARRAARDMARIERCIVRTAHFANHARARSVLEDACVNDVHIASALHGALAELLREIARERGYGAGGGAPG